SSLEAQARSRCADRPKIRPVDESAAPLALPGERLEEVSHPPRQGQDEAQPRSRALQVLLWSYVLRPRTPRAEGDLAVDSGIPSPRRGLPSSRSSDRCV